MANLTIDEKGEKVMNPKQLYQWMGQIAERMTNLGKWQVLGLALFSVGVVLAEHCQLTRVAEHLGAWGKADSIERRLQRWISNPKIDIRVCCAGWIGGVWARYEDGLHVVLVDETKLSDHLGVMMAGLAYEGRCIPLVWCCYVANQQAAYPAERQNGIILDLLRQIKAALPEGATFLVEADRGIGNSAALMRQVQQLGVWFLFRVKQKSLFRREAWAKTGQRLSALIKPGESGSGHGSIFKPGNFVRVYVHLAWPLGQKEAWCVVTNDPTLRVHHYARRMWHEEGFRDLKSFGWRWDTSPVWQPDHASRLLLVLTLAYAGVISQEVLLRFSPSAIQTLVERGSRHRFSVFRRALRYLRQAFVRALPILLDLFFVPSLPYA